MGGKKKEEEEEEERRKKKKEEGRRRRDLGELDWTVGGGRNSEQRLEAGLDWTGLDC